MSSKLTRKEMIDAVKKNQWLNGMPNQYWNIDGEFYFSKNEMPDKVRDNVENDERLASEVLEKSKNQKLKFCVNEIEYNSIDEMPSEYQEHIKQQVSERPLQDKYRATIGTNKYFDFEYGPKTIIFLSLVVMVILYFFRMY